MKVKLIAVAALGKNKQIGLRDGLPWSIPDEYDHFKQLVRGEYVLIGRKNFELHEGNVPGAKAIVLTRDRAYRNEKAEVAHDLEDVDKLAEVKGIKQIFVIGGAEIYKLTLPHLSEFHWSEVDYDGDADTFFPDFEGYDWTVVDQQKHPRWTLKVLKK